MLKQLLLYRRGSPIRIGSGLLNCQWVVEPRQNRYVDRNCMLKSFLRAVKYNKVTEDASSNEH
jgi:hypothetical protein